MLHLKLYCIVNRASLVCVWLTCGKTSARAWCLLWRGDVIEETGDPEKLKTFLHPFTSSWRRAGVFKSVLGLGYTQTEEPPKIPRLSLPRPFFISLLVSMRERRLPLIPTSLNHVSTQSPRDEGGRQKLEKPLGCKREGEPR